jgi:hypothetical protein
MHFFPPRFLLLIFGGIFSLSMIEWSDQKVEESKVGWVFPGLNIRFH